MLQFVNTEGKGWITLYREGSQSREAVLSVPELTTPAACFFSIVAGLPLLPAVPAARWHASVDTEVSSQRMGGMGHYPGLVGQFRWHTPG